MNEQFCDRPVPTHVAIIMDGNGRWASRRGLPRSMGHKAGVEAVKTIVRAAREHGIQFLTLFSFSSENWTRPREEIHDLFGLLKRFIRRDLAELHQNNVRIQVIGERDGLPSDIAPLLDEAENLTHDNTAQTLVIAFNYGGRDDITRAFKRINAKIQRGEMAVEQICPEIIGNHLDTAGIPDPDLIIRTSGEQRISNFILWQSAYSEFYFTDRLWPEFGESDFADAIYAYQHRERRFGGLSGGIGS